jgi:hypothetical protein
VDSAARPPGGPPTLPERGRTAPLQDDDSPRSGLRAALRLGDRRGLTATGAVGLALLLGAAGGVLDVATGPGLRSVFAACFVLGCATAAATVHREHLATAVVMPPLVYVVLASAGSVLERSGNPGSSVSRQALELANALLLGAPVLLTATTAALAVALARAVIGADRTRPDRLPPDRTGSGRDGRAPPG